MATHFHTPPPPKGYKVWIIRAIKGLGDQKSSKGALGGREKSRKQLENEKIHHQMRTNKAMK